MIKQSKYIMPFLIMQIFFSAIPILILFYIYYDYNSWISTTKWLLENNFLKILFYTLKTVTITSIINLIISYSVAYSICQKKARTRTFLLTIFFIPAISNFLIQISAIMNLFYNNTNSIFYFISNWCDTKKILYSDISVYIGYVYCYLPLMMISLYNSLIKFNKNLLQASFDLGATFFQTVTKILIPGTQHAIRVSFCLVFVASCGEFIINEILGGDKKLQVGSIISHALLNGSMPQQSIVMILCFIASIITMLFLLHIILNLIIIYFRKT